MLTGVALFQRLVILNGGEAGVRDGATEEGYDVADGNACNACSIDDPVHRNAALRAS